MAHSSDCFGNAHFAYNRLPWTLMRWNTIKRPIQCIYQFQHDFNTTTLLSSHCDYTVIPVICSFFVAISILTFSYISVNFLLASMDSSSSNSSFLLRKTYLNSDVIGDFSTTSIAGSIQVRFIFGSFFYLVLIWILFFFIAFLSISWKKKSSVVIRDRKLIVLVCTGNWAIIFYIILWRFNWDYLENRTEKDKTSICLNRLSQKKSVLFVQIFPSKMLQSKILPKFPFLAPCCRWTLHERFQ